MCLGNAPFQIRDLTRPEAAQKLKGLMAGTSTLVCIICRTGSDVVPPGATRIEDPETASGESAPSTATRAAAVPAVDPKEAARQAKLDAQRKKEEEKDAKVREVQRQKQEKADQIARQKREKEEAKDAKRRAKLPVELKFRIEIGIKAGERLGIRTAGGPALKIGGVDRGSAMDLAGLAANDRIVTVNGTDVTGLARQDAAKVLKQTLDKGDGLSLEVERIGKVAEICLPCNLSLLLVLLRCNVHPVSGGGGGGGQK